MAIITRAPQHRALVGRTLASDVFHRIRDDIISCIFKPGEKLKFETLRDIYGVSFSTLREALTRLVSEGLVDARGQQGFRVAPVSEKDLVDLTELRVMIEAEALRLAIERGDKEWETSVLTAYHRMDRARSEAGERYQLNKHWSLSHREFHDALAVGSNSQQLLEVRYLLFERSERYRRISAAHRTRARSSGDEHREIMEATLSRDVARSVELIKAHIRLTADFVLAAADDWR